MSQKTAPVKKTTRPQSALTNLSPANAGQKGTKPKRGLVAGILVFVLLLGGVGTYWALSSPKKPSALDAVISRSGTLIDPVSAAGSTIHLSSGHLLYLGPVGSAPSLTVTVANPHVLTYSVFSPYTRTNKMPVLFPSPNGGTTKVTVKKGSSTSTFTVVVEKAPPTTTTTFATNPGLTTKPFHVALSAVDNKTITYPANSALIIGPVDSKIFYDVSSSNLVVARYYLYQLRGTDYPAIRTYSPGVTQIKVTWGTHTSSFTLRVTKAVG